MLPRWLSVGVLPRAEGGHIPGRGQDTVVWKAQAGLPGAASDDLGLNPATYLLADWDIYTRPEGETDLAGRAFSRSPIRSRCSLCTYYLLFLKTYSFI